MKATFASSSGRSSSTPTEIEQLVDGLEDVEALVDDTSHGVVRCPECGRLYVQSEYGKNEYVCYKPEPDAGHD